MPASSPGGEAGQGRGDPRRDGFGVGGLGPLDPRADPSEEVRLPSGRLQRDVEAADQAGMGRVARMDQAEQIDSGIVARSFRDQAIEQFARIGPLHSFEGLNEVVGRRVDDELILAGLAIPGGGDIEVFPELLERIAAKALRASSGSPIWSR